MDHSLGNTVLLAVARGLLLIGIVGQVGVASLYVLAPGGSGAKPRWSAARRGLGAGLSLLTIAALYLTGAAQFALFRDPWAPWQEDAILLLGSPWGKLWMGAAALSIILAALWILGRGPRVAAAGALLLAAYPAASGHAAAAEGWAGLAVISQWVHVLAAGAWMGALAVLALIGLAERTGSAGDEPLVQTLGRFSAVARLSVAAIVATGAFATWLHLGSPTALVTEPWGRLLATKLTLVAAVLLLGLRNWKVLSPAAGEPEGARRLVAASRLEAAVGVLVVAISAWLASTSPPG